MMKFIALVALVFVGFNANAADPISGDYRIDDQHSVFITKITDRPNTYYTTVFVVGGEGKACLFEKEMKLASGGLVFAEFGCAIGITKDKATNSVSVVGSCPAHCTGGMNITAGGFKKAADVEPMSTEDLYKGD